ncbi:MAG: aminotransferase class III-fold pyridoxal phosphate-dependent enzyme [Propionibacteriaceae bacterium]
MTELSLAHVPKDAALSRRAERVIPGGMYGHLARRVNGFPADWPQFFSKGEGPNMWDVDGRRYVDMMCGWGPMILGYGWTVADEAAHTQARTADLLSGPGPVMVELAELLVEVMPGADWAMFAKNGTDVTSMACRVARAATGKKIILKAHNAYHGADSTFSPSLAGVTPEDRANLRYFDFNDLPSLEAQVAENTGQIAGVIVTPHQHDGYIDQEAADPEFVRGLRDTCDRIGAALILDEVRTGLRIDVAGAWEGLGIRPDLTALSKSIANGHPLAALTGRESLRDAAASIFVTGSFWYSSAAMAAGVATINHMRDTDGVAQLDSAGQRLRQGLQSRAADLGLEAVVSGPSSMPFLRFVGDNEDLSMARLFCKVAMENGVFMHPWHNWFLSLAHDDETIDEVLGASEHAFAAVSAVQGG